MEQEASLSTSKIVLWSFLVIVGIFALAMHIQSVPDRPISNNTKPERLIHPALHRCHPCPVECLRRRRKFALGYLSDIEKTLLFPEPDNHQHSPVVITLNR